MNCIYSLLFAISVAITRSYSTSVPKLTPLHSRTQTDGTLFIAVCSTEQGSVPLFFQWFKNDQLLKNSHKANYKIETFEKYSTFVISSINKTDAANYSCVVKNSMGSDSQSIRLTVKVPLKWLKEPNDTRINAGEQLTIECSADGLPKPTVKWITYKGDIIHSEMLSLKTNSNNNSAQKYECIADNGIGDELRKIVTIRFTGKSE